MSCSTRLETVSILLLLAVFSSFWPCPFFVGALSLGCVILSDLIVFLGAAVSQASLVLHVLTERLGDVASYSSLSIQLSRLFSRRGDLRPTLLRYHTLLQLSTSSAPHIDA